MNKITISDIASKAGVSRMTVSRVLSGNGPVAEETAKKIKNIMAEMNYQPNLIARSLSIRRSMTLGVLIPKTEQLFLDNYIAQVLSGMTDVAQEYDYRITLLPVNQSRPEKGSYVNYAGSNLFDGLILVKAKMNDPNLPSLAESGFPFVLVNYRKYDDRYNFVDSENVKGAELAMQHLYEKGHRKIAFVEGTMEETNARDRLKGYKNSIKKFGLAFNEEYIICGEFDKEVAHQRAELLLNLKDRPTAIFCSDDYMALGVIERIKDYGLSVPEDIAVVGFDNIEISELTIPSLTTVKQPIYEIGMSASSVLLDLIGKKRKPPIRKILKTELIIRESA